MGRCPLAEPELSSERVEVQDVAENRAIRLPMLRVGVLAVGGFDDMHVVEALHAAGLVPIRDLRPGEPVDATVVAAASAHEMAAVAESLAAAEPSLPVVGVVTRLRPGDVGGALQSGVAAILEHDHVDACLGIAVRAACAGLVAVPSHERRAVAGPVLTTREKQILALVVLGFTNAEIARKLYVAESTVKSHLSSAFAKLGVRSRNEAAARILDQGSGLGIGILAITQDAEPSQVPTPAAV
jgi:DNA-binding NarL/FixJ family response regulator